MIKEKLSQFSSTGNLIDTKFKVIVLKRRLSVFFILLTPDRTNYKKLQFSYIQNCK